MTEELTTELSQVGSLRVVSRTSAMRYKGTQKSVPEIARDLNVDAAAKRALEIDNQLAEAHVSLATNLADYEWDWAGGEREFQTALRLNPNSSPVYASYAHFLRQEGKTEESIREGRRAVELDPVSLEANFLLAQSLYEARRYDEAISQLRKTLDLDPRFWPAHVYLGKTLAEQGHYQEAIEELKKAGDFTPEPYATIGKVLADLQEQSKKGYVAPANFAKIYIGLGDKDQAFAWLEKSYQQHDFWITFLKGEPLFDSLRSDPRFQDLVRRVNFPK